MILLEITERLILTSTTFNPSQSPICHYYKRNFDHHHHNHPNRHYHLYHQHHHYHHHNHQHMILITIFRVELCAVRNLHSNGIETNLCIAGSQSVSLLHAVSQKILYILYETRYLGGTYCILLHVAHAKENIYLDVSMVNTIVWLPPNLTLFRIISFESTG